MLLSGSTRVTTVVSQGCRPIGRPLVVTRAEGNVIHELAGRPAYGTLAAVLEALKQLESEGDACYLVGEFAADAR